MPSGACSVLGQRKKSWCSMARWERKEFHRSNQIRINKGQQPLPKP